MSKFKSKSTIDPTNLVGKRALTLLEFAALGGPGRSRSHELIKAGKLRAVKDGGRTLIPAAEVDRFFAELLPAGGGA